MPAKPKRPRDLNQLAKLIVDMSTGDALPDAKPVKNEAAVTLGRLGGLKGGKARADNMTPERRKEVAQKAAAKRWENKKTKTKKTG